MRPLGILMLLAMGCAAQAPPPDARPAVPQEAQAGKPARRVIDTVWLELRVESVQDTASKLQAAVTNAEGYVADSQIRPTQHAARWTVRIPQERLEAFVAAAQQRGVVLSSRTSAEDVTEQFIDHEARQKAKRIEEARLLKLLEEQSGTLSDVLAVE